VATSTSSAKIKRGAVVLYLHPHMPRGAHRNYFTFALPSPVCAIQNGLFETETLCNAYP